MCAYVYIYNMYVCMRVCVWLELLKHHVNFYQNFDLNDKCSLCRKAKKYLQ